MNKWHLYMLNTAAGSIYTGITTSVDRRLEEHEQGKGAKSLRGKGPLTLVYTCEVGNRSQALKLEARIKKLNRLQKQALIAGELPLPEEVSSNTPRSGNGV